MSGMNIKVFFSVLSCRLARFAIRLLGRGGTDFPGRVALKLCPDVLGTLAKDVTTVIVTGTNGKTTTARMIEQAMTDSGISFFSNRSGANLLSGITAEFAMHSTLSGKCKCRYALIECDEGAFRRVGKYVNAGAIVVTNIFRDQLDRYGEVTKTLESIRDGASHCPDAVLCLNADDSISSSLAESLPNKVLYYGVNTPIYDRRAEEVSDALYCRKCRHPYEYDYVTYGHLGAWRCPNCGAARPEPDLAVTNILSTDAEQSRVLISADGEEHDTVINVPGGYNIYNAVSAVACAKALGLDVKTAVSALASFSCGFGRMEKLEVGKTSIRMILVKNPAGCNQVLNFLGTTKEPSVFAVSLTDKPSDGTDISWIWDVDFERLTEMGEKLSKLLLSGNRADDLYVRLKYAGVPEEKMEIIRDPGALIRACAEQEKPVYMMPTYTAMLQLREKFSKLYGVQDFWK